MRRFRPWTLPIALAGLCLVSGCLATRPTRFYVLSATAEPSSQSAGTLPAMVRVGIGPVDMPPYLDRPQIVSRTGENTLILAERDRWAEPLEDNVTRVVVENLAALLGGDRVVVGPRDRVVNPALEIRIQVLRFEATPGGRAVLSVQWSVDGDQAGEPGSTGRQTYQTAVPGSDYAAVAAALSELLAELSRDLANAVRPLVTVLPGGRR